MNLKNADVLDDISEYPEHYFNTIFTDPPYNLSSKWIFEGDKPVMKQARDFMEKWSFTHEQWQELFEQSFRVLKYGGYCVMFGIDRQLWPIQYYAQRAGFEIHQSLYWYFISSFPKATDVSKQIDKRLGQEREIVGDYQYPDGVKRNIQKRTNTTITPYDEGYKVKNPQITAPTSDLAKIFDGYKYSVAPFKQVVETIMIFRKPTKNKSVLDDLFAWQEGDETISPSVLNIDGGRVPINGELDKKAFEDNHGGSDRGNKERFQKVYSGYSGDFGSAKPQGRYPAQMFADSQAKEVIDKQSGESKSIGGTNPHKDKARIFGEEKNRPYFNYGDLGGAARIMHTCDYEDGETDLVNYCPKVSGAERNYGLENLPDKQPEGESEGRRTERLNSLDRMGNGEITNPKPEMPMQKNTHPTLKPISLCHRIMQLFKLPDEVNQKVYVPFSGTGSEIIGSIYAGIKDIYGCEINQKYHEISIERIKHWKFAHQSGHKINGSLVPSEEIIITQGTLFGQ